MRGDNFLPNPFPPFTPASQSRPGESPSQGWERLVNGKTIGKSIGIGVQDAVSGNQVISPVNMFEIAGPNNDSIEMTITLLPPMFRSFTAQGPIANISGTQTNRELSLTGQIMQPFAILEWGCGGISSRAEVDIHNGAKVRLSGSFVRISAGIDNPPGDQGQLDYQLGAFISPGGDKGLGAQRSVFVNEAPPAAADTQYPAAGPMVPVPAYARRVRLAGVDVPQTGGFLSSIIFFRDQAGTVPICQYLQALNTPDSFFIPAGAYYFALVTGVANTSIIQAIFDLAI